VLNKQFNRIKSSVSDLHHDVTTRRCLTSYERVESIVSECQKIKTELDRADALMDRHGLEFQLRWEADQLRIRKEQALYRDEAQQLVSLKAELRQLLLITQQLEPYIRSISSLMRSRGWGPGSSSATAAANNSSRMEQPERDTSIHFLPPQHEAKQRLPTFCLSF
jgi:predicted ATPase